MPNLTKPRRRSAPAQTNGNGRGLCEHMTAILERAEPLGAMNLEPVTLELSKIDPSPYQPRQSFPAEEIAELARTIAELGQLQPILVRPKGSRYELVDGERRWRAIRQLPQATIRAEVRTLSDAQARAIVLVSALQRKDLNPIEEALAFQAALDAGDAPTQEALAQRLGITQGQVSNRLRLLELPQPIRSRIISGEIPPSHARELVPYAGHKTVIDAIAKEMDRELKQFGELPPVGDFRENALPDWIGEVTESMEGHQYDQKSHQRVPVFKPTDQQRQELGLIEIPTRWGTKKRELRATNRKLWRKLQEEHAANWLKTHAKSNGQAGRAKPADKPAKDKPLSAAEKKRLEAEAKRKRQEADRRTANRVWELWIDWQRYLVAARIRDGQAGDQAHRMRLVGYFLGCEEAWHMHGARRQERLVKLLQAQSIKVGSRKDGYWSRPAVLAAFRQLADPEPLVTELVASLFWADDRPQPVVPPADVQVAAELLGLDLGQAWKQAQLGPLSEAYWDTHTKEQLEELAGELGVYLDPGKPKSVAVRVLAQKRPVAMPKELKHPKPKR